MMKRMMIAAAMALCLLTAQATEKTFQSPDGKMAVTVNDEGGRPTYQVTLDGTTFIERSPLGVKMNFGDLSQGLTLKDCKTSTVKDEYSLKTIKQSHVSYEATEAVCQFEKQGKPALDVIFRVTGRDVAYRYKIYGSKKDMFSAVVESEASSFVLPEGSTTFLCPQVKPMGGFARTYPSYETSYTWDDQMGKNGWGQGYTFPCLFKTTAGWVIISETGTDGNYVGCALKNDGGAKYSIAFPQKEEMDGWGTPNAKVALPALTPWRTMTIGTTLAPIVETTVANDLVQPKYKASKDYTYGKGTWSWIIRMDGSCNYKEQKEYIDFSAALGYRSVLVDAHWDSQIGYDKVAELSRYAKSKGVGLFLWYNSNGFWNDAPQGPRQKMDRSAVRRKEMKWMQENGILGIKVDFFGGDKQVMMQLYEDILTDANEFGLQCIFHGCTLPRGWERMFPNYVASEAVLASENVFFGEGAAIHEPFDLTLHPFCRNAVASIDWGGVIMNKYLSRDNKSRHSRKTTDIFEMASGITNQTSIQCVAMYPNNLQELPQFELDFLKALPTTWDETRFIDGYPGKYVVLARRHGADWYIAGLNAQKEPVKLTLDLTMFAGKTPTIYVDDQKKGEPTMTTLKLDKRGKAKVTIQPNGGLIIK